MATAPKLDSSISWILFNSSQIEEARKLIKTLRGDGTIDALGLGVLLEIISDVLFPATSTLHTWLRYQSFIPALLHWVRVHGNSATEASSELRLREHHLQQTLITTAKTSAGGDKTVGIIGRTRGEQLKYWPSLLYWNSLNTLNAFGPTHLDRTRAFALIDQIKSNQPVSDERESEFSLQDDLTLDNGLTKIAETEIFERFDKGILASRLDFRLSRLEANWFCGRFNEYFPDSLTSALITLSSGQIEAYRSPFSVKLKHKDKLQHVIEEAERYSFLAQGITYAYNAALCSFKGHTTGVDRNTRHLERWLKDKAAIADWSLTNMATALAAYGVTVDDKRLDDFCCNMLSLIGSSISAAALISASTSIIKTQEFAVKRDRSRFRNTRVLIPRNVYEPGEYSPYLFNFRWGVGKRNAQSIIEGVG